MEKPKIKISELKDIYDIEEDHVEEVKKEDIGNAIVSFEDFTEDYDQKSDKKWRSDVEEE